MIHNLTQHSKWIIQKKVKEDLFLQACFKDLLPIGNVKKSNWVILTCSYQQIFFPMKIKRVYLPALKERDMSG